MAVNDRELALFLILLVGGALIVSAVAGTVAALVAVRVVGPSGIKVVRTAGHGRRHRGLRSRHRRSGFDRRGRDPRSDRRGPCHAGRAARWGCESPGRRRRDRRRPVGRSGGHHRRAPAASRSSGLTGRAPRSRLRPASARWSARSLRRTTIAGVLRKLTRSLHSAAGGSGEVSARRSVSRVLSRRLAPSRMAIHLGPPVARRLMRPTRGLGSAPLPRRVARGCALLFGLAPGRVCRVSLRRSRSGGIVTVALVLASRRTGVTRYPALRSSDFPHAVRVAPDGARPSDRLADRGIVPAASSRARSEGGSARTRSRSRSRPGTRSTRRSARRSRASSSGSTPGPGRRPSDVDRGEEDLDRRRAASPAPRSSGRPR